MVTIFEMLWEKRFREEFGRDPTEAERSEVRAHIEQEREERRAVMTPEEREKADEFIDGALEIMRKLAGKDKK